MTPSDDMSQKILRFIHVTGGGDRKVMVFIPRYLWHGTSAVNLLSILKDGFLVDPGRAVITGRLFGDLLKDFNVCLTNFDFAHLKMSSVKLLLGIYLADSFEKSSRYCHPSAAGLNYMLLCRVALGKCYRLNSANSDLVNATPKDYDSLHVLGRKHSKSSITVDGVMIPAYDFAVRSNRTQYGILEFSEYVVRNSERILPRYLVIYR
uniref:Poly [ADP-ribose] polymerase n=1 Tax=Angiostrongylus cantonensis TaxID=6313 RepID=A0A0K0CTE1_ANGCA